jgi:transcriptional regulator with XRE-family HTH domain
MDANETEPHRNSVALTLRRLRTERKLSQSDVARETGISSSFLSLVEQGRSDITIGRLMRLAEFYDVDVTDLLGRNGDSDDCPLHVLRPEARNLVYSEPDGPEIFDLTWAVRWNFIAALAVYQPGTSIDIDLIEGHETLLFVVDGTFDIDIPGREPVRLRRGEGAVYRDIPSYRVRNVSKRIGRTLAVNLRIPRAKWAE